MWGELKNPGGRSGKPPSRGQNTPRLQAILTTPPSRRKFSRDYR